MCGKIPKYQHLKSYQSHLHKTIKKLEYYSFELFHVELFVILALSPSHTLHAQTLQPKVQVQVQRKVLQFPTNIQVFQSRNSGDRFAKFQNQIALLLQSITTFQQFVYLNQLS